jgi:hypothetical protein
LGEELANVSEQHLCQPYSVCDRIVEITVELYNMKDRLKTEYIYLNGNYKKTQ